MYNKSPVKAITAEIMDKLSKPWHTIHIGKDDSKLPDAINVYIKSPENINLIRIDGTENK